MLDVKIILNEEGRLKRICTLNQQTRINIYTVKFVIHVTVKLPLPTVNPSVSDEFALWMKTILEEYKR